jgi:hypothetical protein
MALVARDSRASLDVSTGMYADQVSPLRAGEDLDAAAPCRIHSDGLVYMSNGAAADANAKFDGFTPKAYKAGEPLTLFGAGARFRYSNGGLTPSQDLYIGATAGRLDDAATTGDAVGVARAIDASDIRITRNA